MRPTFLILLLLTACASTKRNDAWDNMRYRDNDAGYTLPSKYTSCPDDAPGCH